MTVRELLARIGADELTEWEEFYWIEPFGDEQRPPYTAAAAIHNAFRGEKGEEIDADRLMPKRATKKPTTGLQTTEQQLEAIKLLKAGLGLK